MARCLTKYEFSTFSLEAVELRDTGKSQREVCNELAPKFNSKAETLRKRWVRHENQTECDSSIIPCADVLDLESEAAIVCVLKAAANNNKAMTKREVIKYVADTYKNHDPNWRGDKWFAKFIQRNENELKVMKIYILIRG